MKKFKTFNNMKKLFNKTKELARKDCNSFLNTRKGLSYLIMRYPNLSLQQAIEEYKVKSLQSTNF